MGGWVSGNPNIVQILKIAGTYIFLGAPLSVIWLLTEVTTVEPYWVANTTTC